MNSPESLGGKCASESGGADTILDRAEVLARVGGDVDLLRELVTIFLEDYPSWLADLGASITRGSARDLHAAAHLLYGTASNFSAPAVTEAARRLESMGRAGDLAGAEAAYAKLVQALDQLRPVLDRTLRLPLGR